MAYTCFTVPCWFLWYKQCESAISMRTPPPSWFTPHPAPLGHLRAPSWAPVYPGAPSHCLFYTQSCIEVTAMLSMHSTICFPAWVRSPRLLLYFCPTSQFLSSIFFWDSIHFEEHKWMLTFASWLSCVSWGHRLSIPRSSVVTVNHLGLFPRKEPCFIHPLFVEIALFVLMFLTFFKCMMKPALLWLKTCESVSILHGG